MRFWDSSALVTLLLNESDSSLVARALKDDPLMVIWWGTPVECESAIRRGSREGKVPPNAVAGAQERLKAFEEDAVEIAPSPEVKSKARALLAAHPLTAADALQLAAAVTWAAGTPAGHEFVTLDMQLADATRHEGFIVSPETKPWPGAVRRGAAD